MALPPPDLARLMHDGVELGEGAIRGTTRVVDLAPLSVPSGRLVMDDPLVDVEPPFLVAVPPGEHRVVLLLVAVRDTRTDDPADERVGLAVVLVGGATVADLSAPTLSGPSQSAPTLSGPSQSGPDLRYEAVVPDDEELADLGDDEFYGYGVDSGTGCFADADALLTDGRHESWQERLLDELDRTARDTWSTAVLSDGRVVAFSSGWSEDGVFPSWTVRSADGRLLAVVTDFLVARDVEHHDESLPA